MILKKWQMSYNLILLYLQPKGQGFVWWCTMVTQIFYYLWNNLGRRTQNQTYWKACKNVQTWSLIKYSSQNSLKFVAIFHSLINALLFNWALAFKKKKKKATKTKNINVIRTNLCDIALHYTLKPRNLRFASNIKSWYNKTEDPVQIDHDSKL